MIIRGCRIEGATLNARATYSFGNTIMTHQGAGLAHWSSLDLYNTNFSIFFWLKFPNNTTGFGLDWNTFLAKTTGFIYQVGWKGWMFGVNTGSGNAGTLTGTAYQINFYFGDQAATFQTVPIWNQTGVTSLFLEKWMHIGVTHNATDGIIKSWLNGRNIATQSISASDFNNTSAMNLAYTPYSTSTANKEMDDILFYSRVLSSAEITEIYGINGLGGTIPADYLLYYPCNSSSGGSILDSSANAKHMTLNGSESSEYFWQARTGGVL